MGAGKYFTFLGILFVNMLVMIILAFRLTDYFIAEFFLICFFIIISLIIIAGVYMNQSWAWKLSSLFFIVFIINIYFMYFNATHGVLIANGAALLAALGFLISVASIGKEEDFIPEPVEEKEPEPIPSNTKIEPYGKKTSTTSFEPGKFIASKTGSVYHTAKCDWAKKVKKKNQVWFKNKQEAGKKGYKKHNCVK